MKNPFLFKRKNGYFYLAYHSNGKRVYVSTGKKNRSEANRFFIEFREMERNKFNVSVNKFREVILNHCKYNVGLKTLKIYQSTWNTFISMISKRMLSEITPADLEAFKEARLRKALPHTVNMDLSTLKASFNKTVRLGYLVRSPAAEIKLIRVVQKDRAAFTKEQIEKLLNAIDDKQFKDFVLFSYYTGCRLGEVLNLEWSDIDYENMVVKVRNKEDWTTKTGKIRYIPISDGLDILLKSMENTGGYLFHKYKSNQKLFRQVIQEKFRHYRKIAGISEKLTYHCLRHTFITNLVNSNVHINYIKELAGHSKLETTLRYIHVSTDNLRSAVNSIKPI